MLGLNRAASHTIRSSESDVRKMAQVLWDSEVAVDKEKRELESKFVDPRREGLLKLEDGRLRNFLTKNFLMDDKVDGKGDVHNERRRIVQDIDDVNLL